MVEQNLVVDRSIETLLLPGMDGTGRLFRPLEAQLPPTLRPCVVTFPSDQQLSYDELLRAIVVPRGTFAIVAQSFSGPLAIRIAHAYPDRVRALVLVATFLRNPSRMAAWIQTFGPRFFRMRLSDAALRIGLLGMDANVDQVAALRAALLSVEPEVLAAPLQEIISVDVSQEFATGTVPVLYVAGGRDRLVGRSVAKQMQRLRPDMQIRVLDAPHLVLQRRPAEVAKVIEEFIASKRR
jgi:pimeloyl-[acyl-carrier protein] methyl ester esterase